MKKILPFSLIVIAALILAACSSSRAPQSISDMAPMAGGGAAPQESYAESSKDNSSVTSTDGSGVSPATTERIVIKNADLTIVVSDVEGRMKNIQVMAQQMGGYVVSSNLYQSYTNNNVEVPEAQISIRVPAEKLEEALEQIKKDTVDIQTETVSGQDVTAEYVDLKSRLKNLEAAEAQLDEILKNATTTDDVVSIFNQLVAYREQIELVKGQIKYYDEAAALSGINIHIIAEATVQPLVIGKWEPKGVALEAVQDLIDFLKGFVEFLIRFVIYILPVWVIIGGMLYIFFIVLRMIYRKIRGNKVQKAQPLEVEKK